MSGLPSRTRPAGDQRDHIPSQTASAGAAAGFSTSQTSQHRLLRVASPFGGFSACRHRDARSGSQQWTGRRVVWLLAMSASNHPTSYETDRNARLPIAVKRSSRDIFFSLRNSRADQEKRSVAPDATAGTG